MTVARPARTTRTAPLNSAVTLLLAAALSGCTAPQRNAAAPGATPRPLAETVRAVWVARMHYHGPQDIATIMRNAAELGFNTVLWQVRGEGTVLYRSAIEPWAAQYDYRDPGFDPLAVAVHEAHRHGLRIEAWINVMPGWKGPNEPPIRNQLWFARPDWFLRDAQGRRQPLGKFYVILNPARPDVRAYIASVAGEIAGKYAVDGIHLDYVRYAWETTPEARELFPRDADTLQIYRQETGRSPDQDPRAWDQWRAEQLTRLVAQIREAVQRRRPGATLTAATWASPSRGYAQYFQDAVGWLRAGLIDAAYPMAYTDDAAALARYIDEYRQLAPSKRVIPGLGIYKHEQPAQLAAQLAACGSWGGSYAVFSYASLHAVAGDRGRRPEDRARESGVRAMRRAEIARFNGRAPARY